MLACMAWCVSDNSKARDARFSKQRSESDADDASTATPSSRFGSEVGESTEFDQSPFDGIWMSKNSRYQIKGNRVNAKWEFVDLGGGECSMFQDRRYFGKLVADAASIRWHDGDVWFSQAKDSDIDSDECHQYTLCVGCCSRIYAGAAMYMLDDQVYCCDPCRKGKVPRKLAALGSSHHHDAEQRPGMQLMRSQGVFASTHWSAM